MTTQAQATGEFEAIEVRETLLEDGALLLLKRAKIIKAGDQLSVVAEPVRDTAMRVCAELDSLPLALDQAGGYIDETRCGLAGYLDRYRRRRSELLKLRGRFDADHPESVATTFALSFEKVADGNPAAADLLRLCAFLRPDAIPEEIFTEGASELGPILSTVAADPLKLDAAFAEILKYSLLRRDGEAKTLVIHRLVQAVIQDGLTEEEKRQWAERAVRAVKRSFPAVEFPNWAQCERLVPHALACAALAETYSFEFEDAARLLNKAGYYLRERALFSDVEPLYQRALAIWEKALGPEHPDVATSLNNLAALYRVQGEYAQAEPLYQRALGDSREGPGSRPPRRGHSLNNLAALYDDQGKYAQAEPLYQRALAIREKALGPDHPDVAASLNNLAGLYRAQGKYAEAEPLYQRALAIWEKALGPEHPDVATGLNNLADALLGPRQVRAGRAALPAGAGDLGEGPGPRAPRRGHRASTTWRSCTTTRASTPRPSRSTSGPWRSGRRPWARSTPTWPPASTTWPCCTTDQGKYARGRAALPAGAGDLGERPWARSTLTWPPASTTWRSSTAQGRYAEAEPLYQRALAIREKALVPSTLTWPRFLRTTLVFFVR